MTRNECPSCFGYLLCYSTKRIGATLIRYRRCERCGATDKLALDISHLGRHTAPRRRNIENREAGTTASINPRRDAV